MKKGSWPIRVATAIVAVNVISFFLFGANEKSPGVIATEPQSDAHETTVSAPIAQAESSENGTENVNETETEYFTEQGADGELPEISSEIVEKLVEAGYTVEQASNIQQVLNTVGITEIEIYGMTGDPESGLNAMSCYANGAEDDMHRFTMTTEDGEIFYVGFLNEDLYDVDQGGYLKDYSDVHVPETEVDVDTFLELQLRAEDAVRSCLAHPSTADFDMFAWGAGRSDDLYKITGRVSAANSFGVEDELSFGVWFEKKDDSFDLTGVEINGVRVR